MSRVPITAEIRAELRCLQEDTNLGPQRLLKGKRDRPKGLSSTTIYQWMDGSTQTASKEHLDWVLKAWRNVQPLVEITDADIALLDQELARTGYTQSSILRRLAPVPEGLTPDILHRLKSKRLKKIPRSHISFLLDGLNQLPDRLSN